MPEIQAKDTISMEILEDGTITVNTDAISKENHLEAEQLLEATFAELGGEHSVVMRKPHTHGGHTHVHGKSQVRT